MVDPAGSRLRLSLSCDCRAQLTTDDGEVLIDFHDPDENALEIEQGAAAPASQPLAVIAPPSPEPPAPYRRPEALGPAIAPPPPAKQPQRRAAAPRDVEETPVDAPLSPADLTEIEIAQQRLLEQLTRAAEQGLVEFRDPAEQDPAQQKSAPPEPVRTVTPSPPEPRRPLREEPGAPVGPVELPVRARTAIDREFRSDRSDTVANQNSCVDDDDLAISEWGAPGPLNENIAAYRRNLLEEFDRPDPGAVLGLTRLYAHNALGAEARQIVRLYGAELEQAELLYEMAAVLDGERPPIDGVLGMAGPCSGRAALWHGAARLPILPSATELKDDAALLDAFAELPIGLRRILGPPLILNALDRNDLALAMKLDLLLQRVPGDHGQAYRLVKARLKHARGLIDEAEEMLAQLALEDGPEGAEALLLLHKSKMSRGVEPTADMTELLAMAAFMQRDRPLGRRLKIAEFASRAGSDGLPAVLEQIAESIVLEEGDDTEIRDAGHAILETSSAAETGPVVYARSVLEYEPFIARDASGDNARVVIAGQLVEIGLANAALDVLAPAFGRRGAPARKSAARAFLAVDDPQSALEALDGLQDAEAIRLRAQALEKSGAPEAALEVLGALSDAPAEQRADLSWQAGAWEGATEAGPEDRRILAGFMAGQTAEATLGAPAEPGTGAEAFLDPPTVAEDLTLRDAKSVMEASEAVRTLIEEALNDG